MPPAVPLHEIVAALGGEFHGDPELTVDRLAPLHSADPSSLTFLAQPRLAGQLATARAACVIVAPAQRDAAISRGAAIIADDPYLYYARLSQWWVARHRPRPAAGVDPSAVVEPGARIHASASVGAFVFVGARAEIGANTCIDRGALDDTQIGDGVKLDNLIQIGHNVRIGAHSALAGCVGVAGSAVIGAHCTVGGGAVILGHLTLADHVHISAASVVTRSILKPGQYSGVFPIDDNASWEKNAATLRNLHALRERLRAIEKNRP